MRLLLIFAIILLFIPMFVGAQESPESPTEIPVYLFVAENGDVLYIFPYNHEGQRTSVTDGTTTTMYPNKLYNTNGTKEIKHIFDAEGNTIATVETVSASATDLIDTQSFETSLGSWKNSSFDDCDWRRDSGGTPSSSTGPSTGYNSSYYAYVETSWGYCYTSGDTADLEYALSEATAGTVEFYYHMYGSNIGALNVDAYNGSTWDTVWTLSSNQGNSWSSLQTANFPAGTTKIRFHYTAAGSYRGDAAIDLVRVYEEIGEGTTTAIYYNHPDHLTGSNVITNEDGTLEQTIDYYPFGGIRLDEKIGEFDEQRKFTGQEYDADTNLHYYVQRYYNQDVGRFTSQDPVFLATGTNNKLAQAALSNPQLLNSYSYTANNPLKYVDEQGEFPFLIVAAAVLGGVFLTDVEIAQAPDVGQTIDSTPWNPQETVIPDYSQRSELEQFGIDLGFGLALGGVRGVGKEGFEQAAKHIIPKNRFKHIFRDAPGHIPDTAQNRRLLQDIADDPNTKLGPDKWNAQWSAKINDDGTQTWVRTRDGQIVDGGINQTPRTYNPETGLSAKEPPNHINK